VEQLTKEGLLQLIEDVKNYQPKPLHLTVTHAWVEAEQAAHPGNIESYNGELFWCGYPLSIIGDSNESN
jgi:hypothetical protein